MSVFIAPMRIAYFAPIFLIACGKAAMKPPPPAPLAPEPVVAPEPIVAADPLVEPELEADAALPMGTWSSEGLSEISTYDDAVAAVRIAHATFDKAYASVFTTDGGLPAAAEFEKANSALELLNRRYAAAYYASDATGTQRVAMLEQAAEVLLRWLTSSMSSVSTRCRRPTERMAPSR